MIDRRSSFVDLPARRTALMARKPAASMVTTTGAFMFLLLCGCGNQLPRTTGHAELSHCFVLPGAGSGATKSYRVKEGGQLAEAGEVSGGAMHMRAAFHPDGRTLYVSSVGPAGWQPEVGGGTWEEGIHVRAYAYDPADCSIGALLGTGRMGPEPPERERAYGLEVHPNGRWLYQTTNSLQRIRLFDLPEDRVPVPREAFDATEGGEHACVEIRRLAMHPSTRFLYANCNNGELEDALQVWTIEGDGSITLGDHYTFPAIYGGVFDPVIHPSGEWLYQPTGTSSPDAPGGSGAYVLLYRVGEDGRLTLHNQVPVRTVTAADSVEDPTSVSMQPSAVVLHPDGSTAYMTLSVRLATPTPGPEDFAHELAIHRVADGGARLVERARMPALRKTAFSSHHGATLAAYAGELFLYSFLTDYDTIQGGVLQRLRVTQDHSLEPLDPPWVATGLFDGRQPIALPGSDGIR